MDRRTFNKGIAVSLGASMLSSAGSSKARAAYRGPNVVIVRFGGGVRRRETIDPQHTYAPYLQNTLTKRGMLMQDMQIANIEGMDTSQAEGTINILTGRYAAWRDATSGLLLNKIEPTSPTLFEYLRKAYDIAPHEALLINGEDRPQEEFFSFARHKQFGGDFRAEVLSLYRYKRWLYDRLVEENSANEALVKQIQETIEKIEKHQLPGRTPQNNRILDAFWERWRDDYRDDGLVNPRGDRLLTELAIRAMQHLQPRLMMINYQDPDYVHWGNASHYTRAIAVIDQGLQRIVSAAETLERYAGNTVFVIVPDCGRDSSPLKDLPFQHHFNTRSAREIWTLIVGPGIVANRIYDRSVDQSQVAATVGAAMGFKARFAEGEAISAAFT